MLPKGMDADNGVEKESADKLRAATAAAFENELAQEYFGVEDNKLQSDSVKQNTMDCSAASDLSFSNARAQLRGFAKSLDRSSGVVTLADSEIFQPIEQLFKKADLLV